MRYREDRAACPPASAIPRGLSRRHLSRPLAALVIAGMHILTACAPDVPAALPTATPAGLLPTATAIVEPAPTPTTSHEDVHEPNDSMLEATGPLLPGEEYEGYIDQKNDIDYFYLEIDSPQTIRLSLTNLPADADYDLYLVTGEEDILSDSANSGPADEFIEYTTSSVGVFYVLVLPFRNFSDTQPYALELELAPAPTPSGEDTYEPNNTFGEAVGPLATGEKLQSYIWDEGDVDIYFFEIGQSADVAIMLTEIPAVAHYGIVLYNEAGEELASVTRALPYATIQTTLGPGTYYVTVHSFAGFSTDEPYTLEISSAGP
jgi:hypothetical protein